MKTIFRADHIGCLLRPPALLALKQLFHRVASVQAQAYPAKPVRLVVGIAPGGGLDVSTRIVAHGGGAARVKQIAEASVGQAVVIGRCGHTEASNGLASQLLRHSSLLAAAR